MSLPESLGGELRRRVREAQSEKRLPSVSAAVAREGEVIWTDAVGLAAVDEGRETTPDTQYRVGSITKTFTAAAIMRLRDEGALALEDPLAHHLPESPHAPTLRRLLSHASGLQREAPGDYWETLELPTRDEMIRGLGAAEQVLAPGAAWHYSNLAFAALGEVVARKTGMPYERVVQERFLEPLGLRRTSWSAEEPAARGYLVEPYSDAVRPEPDLSLSGLAAAGDLWSTPRDLVMWGSFLADPDEEVLRPETVDEMHTIQVMVDPDGWTSGWGLGVSLHRDGDRIVGGHGGGMPGFLSGLAYLRKEKVAAAAVANGYADMLELAIKLVGVAADAFPAEPEEWRPDEAPPPEIAALLGRWWSEGEETILSYRNGRLEAVSATRPGKEPSVFEQEGADLFRTVSGRERGELLRVVRDESGDVVKLYWATYPFLRTPEVFGRPVARR